MKASTSVLLLLGLAAFVPSAQASVLSSSINPVTRVVELLKGLAQKTEEEGKKEEDMYETYVCWAKTVITTKTESNKAAKSRIDSLEAFVADLDAGRIDLTGEGGDLAKEVGQLRSDMETAKALRDKEHDDFKAAKKEMEQGIAALEKAVDVLKEATKDSKGSLLRVKGKATEGFQQRVAESKVLKQAVDYSKKVLSAGDARFLEHLLTGEVPHALVSKPGKDFKMKYKMRSGKIQKMLKKLLDTFEDNLKTAKDKEKDEKDEYDKLMDSKGDQLEDAEDALNSMDGEGAARGLAKEEAEQERDDLKEQIKNDEKYIEETEDALKEKKEEHKARKKVRSEELAAISKAINILYSDEARDLMKESAASQGGAAALLLQKSASSTRERQKNAASELIVAARRSSDNRLKVLAARVGALAGGHFDDVIKEIEKLIETIEEEEKDDKDTKETCEDDLKDNTADAKEYSEKMDELADEITKLTSDIKDLNEEIADKQAQIKKTQEELDEAQRVRDDENANWKKNDAADKAASELVEKAKEVLEDFYNNQFLLQLHAHQPEEFQSAAGEEPPPPPATAEGTYKGNQDAGTGIIDLLGKVKDDIDEDRKDAKKEEKESKEAFDKFKDGAEEKIKNAEDAIADLEDTIGKKEDEMKTAKEDRMTKSDELKEVMETMMKVQPECDFMMVNYKVRKENRETEIKGLKRAKKILEKDD
eukprot:gnl/TRDRNA2_/TRDRNA2_177735_c1_seq6.p1 gnl/TRDRNA2_/TRDRNA2_177735_c1~~gnl/TRDRNA2_/TRDRNA2_177735_c1_seq6.p1  ORF type:complete len:707 (+),score=306.28 gnl/TRDRNA2_/TRDRNA2_177735_c1_seq6:74-2194(+)